MVCDNARAARGVPSGSANTARSRSRVADINGSGKLMAATLMGEDRSASRQHVQAPRARRLGRRLPAGPAGPMERTARTLFGENQFGEGCQTEWRRSATSALRTTVTVP